ncbi:MAG: hypothetical protein MRZ29_09390 [Oscillospiraceae bacterium]|nr:hypothetical protein [Oscillospiraceae bacterium]
MKNLKSLSLVLVLTVVFSSFALSAFAAAEDRVIISSIDDLPELTNFTVDAGKINVSKNGNILSLTSNKFANGVTNYRLPGNGLYEAGYRFITSDNNQYLKLGNISFDYWKNYKKLRLEFNIKIANDTDGISFRTQRFTAAKVVSGGSNAYYIFSVGGKNMITPLSSSANGYTYRTVASKNSAISKGEWHNVVIEIGANGINKEVKFFIDNADVSDNILLFKGNTNNNTETKIEVEPMKIQDESIGFGGEWAKGCVLIPNGKRDSAFGVELSGLKMTATNTDFTPRAGGKIIAEELKGTANTETGKIDTSAIVYNLTGEEKSVRFIIGYYDSEGNLADVEIKNESIADVLVTNINHSFNGTSKQYASAKAFVWTDSDIIPLSKSAGVVE